MTKVPARPSAVVPPRPAVPAQGVAAVPAAAKVVAPAATPAVANEVAQPVAVTNPGTVPITGISQNDGAGGTASPPVAGINVAASTTDQPNPTKTRGRKKGSGTGKGPPKKAVYHGLLSMDENGAPVMVDDGKGGQYHQRLILGDIPTDYDPKTMERLKPSDFQDESVFCAHMQQVHQNAADSWAKKAKRLKALGSATDQKKAAKFFKMREEMAKLAEQLRADGMDVDSLDSDDEATAE